MGTRFMLFSALVAFVAVSFAGAQQSLPRALEGAVTTCLQGREHRVSYNVVHTTSAAVYDIDTFTALEKVECNVDQSALKIVWHDEIHSTAFWAKVKTFGAFLTGSSCPLPISDQKKGFVLRRVTSSRLDGQALYISTVPAGYDEIYEDADIEHEPTGSNCGITTRSGADKRVCV